MSAKQTSSSLSDSGWADSGRKRPQKYIKYKNTLKCCIFKQKF